MPHVQRSHRHASILLLLLGIITISLVIAFAFLRSMQMARGTTLVQRKDDLARLAAEMGMQHAVAVCTQQYAMASEVRDDLTVAPVSRSDSLESMVFAVLSRRAPGDLNFHQPKPYDLAPDEPFHNLFTFLHGGVSPGRTHGYSGGVVNKPGYARLMEANRFQYDGRALYDPATYDLYTAATPNPGAVQTPFPPVDPFVRGAAITRHHPSDNPLLLDADCRPVVDAKDARFRLRYAVDIKDMSGSLWLNTDMPWLTSAQKALARNAYKEAFFAVGMQLSMGNTRSDTFENILLGHGSYANSRFVNGQPREWPERGGGPMWFRSPNQTSNRAFHCVHGSPFMNWNDPGGVWIGSAIPSFNDLGFALQGPGMNWHMTGETANNEDRVRGEAVGQYCATPFGRPMDSATDHPWSVNALLVPPRVLEAMVAAYMPPAIRAVAVTSETCTPYTQTVDALGNVSSGFRQGGNQVTWTIPSAANLTISGSGPDLFTDAYAPGALVPFAYPTPAMRDYWTTPVGAPGAPATWRPDHTPPADARPNSSRYPGSQFFSDPVIEKTSQAVTCWRWLKNDAVTPHNGVATSPRQVVSDPLLVNPYTLPTWSIGASYVNLAMVTWGGSDYTCTATHTAAAVTQPGVGASWGTVWSLNPAPTSTPYTPTEGVDHLGRHIVFYKPDGGGTAAAGKNKAKYLSAYFGANCAQEFDPSSPTSPAISGPGTDGRLSPYKGSSTVIYSPTAPVVINGEVYPVGGWSAADKLTAALTHPSARGGAPLNVITPQGWQVSRAAGSWGNAAQSVYPNSYYNRLSLAFWHAVGVAQQANLAWANHQDSRTQTIHSGASGVMYASRPDDGTSFVRKGKTAFKHPSDPKGSDQWTPAAADYTTVEQLDRQFLANLGESFNRPGQVTPEDARATLPPRYTRWSPWRGADGTLNNFQNTSNMQVGEYRVTNNIRTLLTPIDTIAATNPVGAVATLTGSSTSPQGGANEPPHKLWLLDEWNVGAEAGYVPGTTVGLYPTAIARARAKMMERVLNDWRLSFFGSSKDYAPTFRPKDFDGDGKVFCSGYLTPSGADPDCGLTCWKTADGNGDGPGANTNDLTVFSVTGCLAITRSHQYKIHVRGELYDNFLDRAVSEQYLESAYLVDPDSNVSRGALNTGMEDSVIIHQRPIHNYYRGYLNRAYP